MGVAATANLSRLVKFRSYQPRRGQEPNLPIWKVARATLTHAGSLPPIQLGPELAPVTYVSGELGWNNPSRETIKEFESEWRREGILCFVSIGTGHRGTIQIDSSSGLDATHSTAQKMASDCQKVAEEIAHRFQEHSNYFRLSVEQGLQLTDNEKVVKMEDVIVHTKAYLDSASANSSVNCLVASLLGAAKVFPWQTTRERFEQAIGAYICNTRSRVSGITNAGIMLEASVAVSTLELIQVCIVLRSTTIAYTQIASYF